MENIDVNVKKILDIGVALTTEKSYNKLLELILNEIMEITSSDAGTLYLCEPDGLKFIIMRNNTMNTYQGGGGEAVQLPKVPLKEENVCAYAVIHKKSVNIKDVHCCDEFDFSGPRNYDKITGYHTKSMYVIPLESHEGEVLGVIQVINSLDKDRNVVFYDEKDEYIVNAIASLASISLANMLYMNETKDLLYSTVSVMATAIDERTPYNANHTYNVAQYTDNFLDYLNVQYEHDKITEYFDENRKEQLVMAAMLHDIGKLVIPIKIMNKFSRLSDKLVPLLKHLELIRAYIKIDYLEQYITKQQWKEENDYITKAMNVVQKADSISYINEEIQREIEILGKKSYTQRDGTVLKYVTEEELEDMLIQKGTLTARERAVMESHVEITAKLLSKIHFSKNYSKVSEWASGHHEYLNGTGYPKHLKGEEISFETRILVIIDIFEALTSSDRPYKKAMSFQKALGVLKKMAEEEKLDGLLVALFCDFIRKLEKFPHK